jgi:hypothetical protein
MYLRDKDVYASVVLTRAAPRHSGFMEASIRFVVNNRLQQTFIDAPYDLLYIAGRGVHWL